MASALGYDVALMVDNRLNIDESRMQLAVV
jgi:hypothetical protein